MLNLGITSFIYEWIKKETDTAALGTATFFTVPESFDSGPSRWVFYTLGAVFALGVILALIEHCRKHLRERRTVTVVISTTYGTDDGYL